VVSSGNFVLGEQVKKFEFELASYVNVEFASGVANGTDALEIALRAIGVSNQDTIVATANAGGYTRTAAERIGCITNYVDTDKDSALISIGALAQYLEDRERPAAVVVTHLYGNMADVRSIVQLCEKHDVPVIEDCAQSIGASLANEMCGSIGKVSTFSFFPTKNLGGIGDGGAVLTSDAFVAEKIQALRQYGWSSKYHVDSAGGFNSRLDEIQASVLSFRLKNLESENSKRRRILAAYSDALSDKYVSGIWSLDSSSVGHLAVVRVGNRGSFQHHFRNLNIETGIHYPILDTDQKAWSSLDAHGLINSEKLQQEIVTIPCFPTMTEEEIFRVVSALDTYKDN
jgi:dTDP-4-amino-4,6-dideoxygalactose transaminase